MSACAFAVRTVAVAGALCLCACDKLLPKDSDPKWKGPKAKAEESASVASQFSDARVQIMTGKHREAAAALRKLEARSDVPQPMHNWITLYAGFAELFAGREAEARPLFAKLEERKLTGNLAASDPKLTEFFVTVGHTLAAENSVPTSLASKYDRFNYEAIALLLYALKDEAMGDTESSATFYRQFTTSESDKDEPWPAFNTQMQRFRKNALNVLENEDEFAAATAALRAANAASTPEDKKSALDEVKASRSRIKGAGKLSASLDAAIAELEPKIAAQMGEQTRKLAEDEAFDAKALQEAKAKRAELVKAQKFAEAKQAIMAPDLRTEKGKAEQDALARQTNYLENFRYNLIKDLTGGYAKPVTLKNGTKADGVAKLDEQNIHVLVKGKVTPVAWAEVAPESIFEMAKSLIKADTPPEILIFRKWYLGVYAAFIGKTAEARGYMKEAAEANPIYEPEIPFVLGAPL